MDIYVVFYLQDRAIGNGMYDVRRIVGCVPTTWNKINQVCDQFRRENPSLYENVPFQPYAMFISRHIDTSFLRLEADKHAR